MRVATLILAGLFALEAIPGTLARPAWITGTFVYADLCTDRNAGRLEGRRVTVRRSPNGDGVLYETALGTVTTPVPTEALLIDDGTRQIAFSVAGETGPMRFQGVAASDILAGTLRDGTGERPLRLRRVLRSHERESCRTIGPEPEATAAMD